MKALHHVLLISCSDQPGIIHRVTGVILKHGLNIVENHEFVDRTGKTFSMRTEFSGSLDSSVFEAELRKELPSDGWFVVRPQKKRRLILLATREPHCLGDLLLRHEAGELNAEIFAVVSQYDSLARLTKRFDVPFHHVPVHAPGGVEDRVAHEGALKSVIDPYQPDYLVLAKYMRVLSPAFVGAYSDRVLNIHHSFLPAFIGKNPYAQAHARGVKIIGATAHFVNDQLDAGPIITQSVIPISHALDAAALARAGRDVEKIVLAKALGLVLEDRVIVQGQRTLVFE